MQAEEKLMSVIIERGSNPYRDNVQGKANEPITVAGLLGQANQLPGAPDLEVDLYAIYDRLEANAPRVAIIGGSPDHPAHILDRPTALRAAARIWLQGGVPFYFSIPVLCDGTTQSNIGMSYSLQSRNAVAEMVVNQMEAHSYHGAFVLSGCDKTPLAIAAGLAHLDTVRQARGDAPLFATFCPSHVLRGGTFPPDLLADLEAVAEAAEEAGHPEIAADLRDTLAYILQCTTNEAYKGVLTRARQVGVVNLAEQKDFERRLAVNTCHHAGGICAFNGTGNSSRNVVAALGLTHPAVELLTEPPNAEQVGQVVDDTFTFVNAPEYSVAGILTTNFANAVRAHSATGGSTNLMMHMVAAMIYAGYDVDVRTIDRIRRGPPPVPDVFDYSLTHGRDIFVLAQQVRSGAIRGMETIFFELVENGVPMDLSAPTVAAATWGERLADTANLSAAGVPENPIILSQPRRPFSGVDVLEGNFFESAVVKISGMTSEQLAEFDDQVCLVLFFENEDAANAGLLDTRLLERLRDHPAAGHEMLLAMARHNGGGEGPSLTALKELDQPALFERMAQDGLLKVAMIISGQGPEAFGMPEMFTSMQHINANRELRKLTVLLSDGRYSGVTYGAAIGHVTPEAFKGGGIGLLQTGDLLRLRLSQRRVDLIAPEPFSAGRVVSWDVDLAELRADLRDERRERLLLRQRRIAATNRLRDVTDASRGVVPLAVAEGATQSYPGTTD
jgi:dihydroxyacid dehydratase/phosphogluconate dehydratase